MLNRKRELKGLKCHVYAIHYRDVESFSRNELSENETSEEGKRKGKKQNKIDWPKREKRRMEMETRETG